MVRRDIHACGGMREVVSENWFNGSVEDLRESDLFLMVTWADFGCMMSSWSTLLSLRLAFTGLVRSWNIKLAGQVRLCRVELTTFFSRARDRQSLHRYPQTSSLTWVDITENVLHVTLNID